MNYIIQRNSGKQAQPFESARSPDRPCRPISALLAIAAEHGRGSVAPPLEQLLAAPLALLKRGLKLQVLKLGTAAAPEERPRQK
eukprot:548360-Pyramimonas_sp.AAC.1